MDGRLVVDKVINLTSYWPIGGEIERMGEGKS